LRTTGLVDKNTFFSDQRFENRRRQGVEGYRKLCKTSLTVPKILFLKEKKLCGLVNTTRPSNFRVGSLSPAGSKIVREKLQRCILPVSTASTAEKVEARKLGCNNGEKKVNVIFENY
jgi:hypothetical protein